MRRAERRGPSLRVEPIPVQIRRIGRRYRVFEPHASEQDVAQRPEQDRILQDNGAGRRLLRARREPADRNRVNAPPRSRSRPTIGAVDILDPFTEAVGCGASIALKRSRLGCD